MAVSRIQYRQIVTVSTVRAVHARESVMLTAVEVKEAKYQEPGQKPRRLSDEKAMYLLITDKAKYWRLDYRIDGKRKTLALGVYPEVSLADARKARDEARALVRQGVDPCNERKVSKALRLESGANTVESIAREWYERKHRYEVVESHAARNLARLEGYIFPSLGNLPITGVTGPELLRVLRVIEAKGYLETAHRVQSICSKVWRYAVATGRAERDITLDIRGALPAITKREHLPAIVEPEKLGELLRAIDAYPGYPVVCAALKVAPLLFVRPGELRRMEWSQVNLDAATWDYTPSKGAAPMVTPLSRQVVEVLRGLHAITGRGRWVFPLGRHRQSEKPMSENAITGALTRMGYTGEMTGHGFRAAARTILDEVLGYPVNVIEMALAHAVKDANGRAYNRTTYLEQRKKMMQAWADYLDGLKQKREPESIK